MIHHTATKVRSLLVSLVCPPPRAECFLSASATGHRRNSFIEQDIDELVELRARQRTFDGALAVGEGCVLRLELTVSRDEQGRTCEQR